MRCSVPAQHGQTVARTSTTVSIAAGAPAAAAVGPAAGGAHRARRLLLPRAWSAAVACSVSSSASCSWSSAGGSPPAGRSDGAGTAAGSGAAARSPAARRSASPSAGRGRQAGRACSPAQWITDRRGPLRPFCADQVNLSLSAPRSVAARAPSPVEPFEQRLRLGRAQPQDRVLQARPAEPPSSRRLPAPMPVPSQKIKLHPIGALARNT